MHIRRAEPDDLDEMVEMGIAFHNEVGLCPTNETKLAEGIEATVHKKEAFVLCRSSGEIVGSCAYEGVVPWWTDEVRMQDKWFFLKMDARSLHNYKHLIKALIEQAKFAKVPLYVGLHVKGADRKAVLLERYCGPQIMEHYQATFTGGWFRAKGT